MWVIKSYKPPGTQHVDTGSVRSTDCCRRPVKFFSPEIRWEMRACAFYSFLLVNADTPFACCLEPICSLPRARTAFMDLWKRTSIATLWQLVKIASFGLPPISVATQISSNAAQRLTNFSAGSQYHANPIRCSSKDAEGIVRKEVFAYIIIHTYLVIFGGIVTIRSSVM